MHKKTTSFDFVLNYDDKELLYRQVYQNFKNAILKGCYKEGMRIPSMRTLAADLQVSRNTVEKAYDLLMGDGYFVSKGPAGTFVSGIGYHCLNTNVPLVGHSSQASVSKALPFQIGIPALDAFPLSRWRSICQQQQKSVYEMQQLQGDVYGYRPLREAISAYLNVSRGIRCSASQVFITTGYRQSLQLLASTLLKPNDAVWLEDPSFPPGQRLMERLGMQLIPVPVDSDGMNIVEGMRLASGAKMVLLTPANQSPLGTVLSRQRRLDLLSWAASKGAWLVEDDYDGEYCLDERPQQLLSSLDQDGRTFYLGTFSKTMHPALRIAYVVVPEAKVAEISDMADDVLDGCSVLVQSAIAAFMTEGYFALHLKKMRSLYEKRREILTKALQERLHGRVFINPFSRGLSLTLFLGDDCDDFAVAQRAGSLGLSVSCLSSRTIVKNGRRGLLIGFANIADEHEAAKYVDILATCL